MMGKTQRFSKGYSSRFVPDYRHAVETVGETEGFGSSGRVDSEDSSAPKRNCMSLNSKRHDNFNIPLQVISLSKLSRSEKEELEIRLKEELEQVQMLRKKIFNKKVTGLNTVALSSSSDMPFKKQGSIGQNGSNVKRGNSGRFESAKRAPPPSVSNSYALFLKECKGLLDRLLSHQFAWVFNHPVDVVKLNIPDYYQVIKHPMDLGTIKKRIASGSYSPWDFASDVRLTFTNAMTYNPPGNDVHFMADKMIKFFESKWKPIAKKLAAADAAAKKDAEDRKPVLQPKKRKASPTTHDIIEPEIIKPKITIEEKLTISKRLEALADMPQQFIDFLKSHTANLNQSEDEIEVDIDSLSDDALIELKKLLDDYMMGVQSGHQRKAEPCDVEILNESGLSNLSMNHCKGNEPADEDVDIVGNDPPISSYPPVVIEKDAAVRSGKCSSSSSSSSDSGSSSSDSDSGSSSGSESDIKLVSPKKDIKESLQLDETVDHEKSDMRNPDDGNNAGSSNVSSRPEQDAYLKSESIEADRSREGANAPTKRQVSPEKRYRAALLRSRFADTILKAREKTLDQGEKRDPEKLRRDREELERLQREEKARLQAEAKAAEDARRQAEAAAAEQAAAEAKRQRELEREKARQALQQMEKTVDIESSLNPKDLEILSSGPGEHLLSSVGETSPAHSEEGIGGIRLVGSISLELFGLSLLPDGEDEEEVVPNSAPINDAEEGEVD